MWDPMKPAPPVTSARMALESTRGTWDDTQLPLRTP
jgi:hypothetical protein